jgi:hypothetical protein
MLALLAGSDGLRLTAGGGALERLKLLRDQGDERGYRLLLLLLLLLVLCLRLLSH